MLSLTAEKRTIFGKNLAEARDAGKLPVVVYGPKNDSANYFVEVKAFKKAFASAGESTLISLKTEGAGHDVLVQEVAYHPVSGEPIHADFYLVDATKPIQVPVHLSYVGESAAEKAGAILVKVMHEIEIEALPKNLPHEIEVDIAKLETLDSHILVKDLKLPAGVTAISDAEAVVANMAEAKEEPEEPAAPVDLSAIEVSVEKGKKEEEGVETPAAE